MRASLDRFFNTLANWLAMVGAIAIVVMLIHINAYVILRLLLSAPIPATVEIVSSYYMILIAFLPLAWAERRGDMIAIEVFASLYKGVTERAVDIFVALITAATYLVLTYSTWLVAMREYEAGSFVISLSRVIPTWPGYFALPAGFALAFLVALHRLVDSSTPKAAPPEAKP